MAPGIQSETFPISQSIYRTCLIKHDRRKRPTRGTNTIHIILLSTYLQTKLHNLDDGSLSFYSKTRESEGSFQYGNYYREADDLHAVIQHFSGESRVVSAILGHSKGGNVVLLYASKYQDLRIVVNVSGRYDLKRGIAERLGEDFIEIIKKDGHIDVKNKTGGIEYRVTEEALMDRLRTDMHEACLKIDKECRVLTVHGSADEIISVEDALEFAKVIPNHQLHIIEGANHGYTSHQTELASTVVKFIASALEQDKDSSK
ncbi:hypothetical protein E1A91_A06G079200v1 [Gossypium mustelinum]|uniref:Peptidase S9 prolyl oligopeptidase catalytic domain-containing protein n=1 Tax=Gossypium mustelinum TaxID=34275 RepID=A0A5D2YTQ4_GOSMU|nr:hypothetical protein E1A91_A06G079200v1 [Gossypium mustelinum]